MSRIRNILRLQSPEERVLNALLIVVVAVLIAVGISKLREDRAVAAPEVRGIQVERSTTTTNPPVATSRLTTTTTLDPFLVLWYTVVAQNAAGAPGAPAASPNPTAADPGLPATPPPTPTTRPTTRPTSTTTQPRPTTTTTAPRPTTTSSTSTSTTTTTVTAPPVVLGP